MPTNGVCILLKKDMVLDLKFDIKDGKDTGTTSELIQKHDILKPVDKFYNMIIVIKEDIAKMYNVIAPEDKLKLAESSFQEEEEA